MENNKLNIIHARGSEKKHFVYENEYNFVLSNIILAQDKPFTIEKILYDARNHQIKDVESVLKNVLDKLRDNGLIDEVGSTYSVRNNQHDRWLNTI